MRVRRRDLTGRRDSFPAATELRATKALLLEIELARSGSLREELWERVNRGRGDGWPNGENGEGGGLGRGDPERDLVEWRRRWDKRPKF